MAHDSSPYTGEAYASLFLRMEFGRAGHAAAPKPKNDRAYRPFGAYLTHKS